MKRFFTMIHSQQPDGQPFPMMDSETDGEDVKFWATQADAASAAECHPLASKFGYEIFEIGTGKDSWFD